jgi:hypothetical protein
MPLRQLDGCEHMNHALRGVIVAIVVLALLAGAFGAVRWARRGGTAANLAASALLLTFGIGLVATHPQRVVEQVQEERDRTGGETGDPPSRRRSHPVLSSPRSLEPGAARTTERLTGRLWRLDGHESRARWKARVAALIRALRSSGPK